MFCSLTLLFDFESPNFDIWLFSSLLLSLLVQLVLLQQLLLMVQQLLFLQLLVLLTLRKGALTTEAFFQGHFFKAREPTYPRVRIKINKMIFFLSFFCFTRVSSWRTFHRTGAGNLNWKNVFREADKAGPSWAWVEDRGRPWWPRRTPSWGPSASARSTPDTWQHRRLWPSTDPRKQIVKPMRARALRN